jgi:DNA replication initiation complex subunit (GINS family)
MYGEMFEAWRREIENVELQPLSSDFYVRASDYLRKIRDELKALDPASLRAGLLVREQRNVYRMIKELLRVRYEKILRLAAGGQKLSADLLTVEEAKLLESFLAFSEAYHGLINSFVNGQQLTLEPKVTDDLAQVKRVDRPLTDGRVMVRFVKAIPAIIGSDMKTYGPFAVEDVASVPVDNARILVKQGLAQMIEVT